jgi:hypothetical protein
MKPAVVAASDIVVVAVAAAVEVVVAAVEVVDVAAAAEAEVAPWVSAAASTGAIAVGSGSKSFVEVEQMKPAVAASEAVEGATRRQSQTLLVFASATDSVS